MDKFEFVKVTHESLIDFINHSKQRIIYVKPAFYIWEIQEILINAKEKSLILCEIYMEATDEAIRFGFGDKDALKLILDNQDILLVQVAQQIRLSILIVDNNCIIFAPSILHLDNNNELTFPNGFYAGKDIVEKIIGEFPNYYLEVPDNLEISNPFEPSFIENIHQESIVGSLTQTIKKLEDNPPVDLNKLNRIQFYRNNYKILKRQLMGIRIKNKKINLNPFNKLLSTTHVQLSSSWNIFTKEDIQQLEDMSFFNKELLKIDKEYLFDAGRFGSIIRTERKTEYEDKVKEMLEEFIDFLKGKPDSKNRFIEMKQVQEQPVFLVNDLKTVLEKRRTGLFEYLNGYSEDDENIKMEVLSKRHLSRQIRDNMITLKKAKEIYLFEFIDDILKFPQDDEMVDRIQIKMDFYDLSDELIFDNEDFQLIIDKYKLNELREYKEGLEVKEVASSQ